MITESVKNLFEFINFLYEKTEHFVEKRPLIESVWELYRKRNLLKPKQNYKDRIEYDKLQKAFEREIDIAEKETKNIILEKINELKIATTLFPSLNLNAQGDLYELKQDFTNDDLEQIFEAKRKYIHFRQTTNCEYLLEFFFHYLDRDLKEFFDYFKETEQNEFEAFETKAIQVNDIGEALKLFQQDKFQKFTLPNSFLSPPTIQQQPNIEPLPPQPIDEQKPIKYGAKEYALTYIFDLYATGKQVPINRIEGSFDAKKIKQDVSEFPMYDKAPDTFYRAVKSVLEYDLNKPTDLQNISKDWLNAVRNLSTNWVITERYLKDKNLIGE